LQPLFILMVHRCAVVIDRGVMGCTGSKEQKPAEQPAAAAAAADVKAQVLVLFYSTYGHNYAMAKAAAEGAREEGVEVTLKRVAETLPAEVLEKMHALEAAKQWAEVPVAEVSELPRYDAVIFICPTRFGSIPAQMKTFLDAAGQLWFSDALVGKIGSVMTSSATQHGGNETTIRAFHTVLLHFGMIIVGLPYSFKGQNDVTEVGGGSPYGATTVAGGSGERQPSQSELDGSRFQAKHVASIARTMKANTPLA
jgi:NAD(P)H dehydrogenase (quinone)